MVGHILRLIAWRFHLNKLAGRSFGGPDVFTGNLLVVAKARERIR
jgi:hypothetical protein